MVPARSLHWEVVIGSAHLAEVLAEWSPWVQHGSNQIMGPGASALLGSGLCSTHCTRGQLQLAPPMGIMVRLSYRLSSDYFLAPTITRAGDWRL